MKTRILIHTLVGLCAGALGTRPLAAGTTRPVSAHSSGSQSAGGASSVPLFSADGRFVFFLSQAANLVTNDDSRSHLDLFRHDLTSGETILASVNTDGQGGANADVAYASVSSNGQFVAFTSDATNLTADDTNQLTDVFWRDLDSGVTRRFNSAGYGPTYLSATSRYPLLAADGQRVVFEAWTYPRLILARNVSAETNILVSADSQGSDPDWLPSQNCESASMPSDGSLVSFLSADTLLVDLSSHPGLSQREVYVRRLGSKMNLRVSRWLWLSESLTTNYACQTAVLSSDGHYVCYTATSSGDWAGALVIRFEVLSEISVVVASNALASAQPAISADGRFIAHEDGTNVFLWDAQTGSNELVSVNLAGTGPGNGRSRSPVITPDGSKIVFQSDATDLVTNVCNGQIQLFVRDRISGNTHLVSVNRNGVACGDHSSSTAAISDDGRFVAFDSTAADLVEGDENGASDVFVRNLLAGTTQLISIAHSTLPSRTALEASSTAAIGTIAAGTASETYSMRENTVSADGRFVVFTSYDSDLAPGDTNGWQDVFVRDMQTGLVTPVTLEPGGFVANRSVSQAALSADGRYVFFAGATQFSSTMPDLPDSGGALYWRDLQSPSSVWLADGLSGGGLTHFYPFSPSRDGRWVAFQTGPSESSDVYLREVLAGTNQLININWQGTGRANGVSGFPKMSPDGRYVTYASTASDLVPPASGWNQYIYDLHSRSNSLIPITVANSGQYYSGGVTFSPDSRKVAFRGWTALWSGVRAIYVHDLAAGSTAWVCTNCYSPSLNGNGTLVAFEGYESLPLPWTGTMWVKDLSTDVTTLIASNVNGLLPSRKARISPQISLDGRYVVFSGVSDVLVPGDTNNASDIFAHDRQTGKTLLVSMNRFGTGPGNGPSLRPVLGADGRTIVFVSYASDLVEGDFNNQRDVFLVRLGFPILKLTCASGGPTTIFWSAVPGRAYRVQYKDNLSDATWSEFPQTVIPETTTGTFTDDAPSAFGQRFYQVIEAL